jgi:hypothetical protein
VLFYVVSFNNADPFSLTSPPPTSFAASRTADGLRDTPTRCMDLCVTALLQLCLRAFPPIPMRTGKACVK